MCPGEGTSGVSLFLRFPVTGGNEIEKLEHSYIPAFGVCGLKRKCNVISTANQHINKGKKTPKSTISSRNRVVRLDNQKVPIFLDGESELKSFSGTLSGPCLYLQNESCWVPHTNEICKSQERDGLCASNYNFWLNCSLPICSFDISECIIVSMLDTECRTVILGHIIAVSVLHSDVINPFRSVEGLSYVQFWWLPVNILNSSNSDALDTGYCNPLVACGGNFLKSKSSGYYVLSSIFSDQVLGMNYENHENNSASVCSLNSDSNVKSPVYENYGSEDTRPTSCSPSFKESNLPYNLMNLYNSLCTPRFLGFLEVEAAVCKNLIWTFTKRDSTASQDDLLYLFMVLSSGSLTMKVINFPGLLTRTPEIENFFLDSSSAWSYNGEQNILCADILVAGDRGRIVAGTEEGFVMTFELRLRDKVSSRFSECREENIHGCVVEANIPCVYPLVDKMITSVAWMPMRGSDLFVVGTSTGNILLCDYRSLLFSVISVLNISSRPLNTLVWGVKDSDESENHFVLGCHKGGILWNLSKNPKSYSVHSCPSYASTSFDVSETESNAVFDLVNESKTCIEPTCWSADTDGVWAGFTFDNGSVLVCPVSGLDSKDYKFSIMFKYNLIKARPVSSTPPLFHSMMCTLQPPKNINDFLKCLKPSQQKNRHFHSETIKKWHNFITNERYKSRISCETNGVLLQVDFNVAFISQNNTNISVAADGNKQTDRNNYSKENMSAESCESAGSTKKDDLSIFFKNGIVSVLPIYCIRITPSTKCTKNRNSELFGTSSHEECTSSHEERTSSHEERTSSHEERTSSHECKFRIVKNSNLICSTSIMGYGGALGLLHFFPTP